MIFLLRVTKSRNVVMALLLLVVLGFNAGLNAQLYTSTLKTSSSTSAVEIINQDFEDDSYASDWSIITTDGDRSWSQTEYNDNSYMQMNGYEGSSTSTDKDFVSYLITPAIDFDLYDNEVLTFTSKNGYYNATTLSVWVSTDFNGTDADEATWTELSATLDETENTSSYSSSFTASGDVDLSLYEGSGYVAFKWVGNNTTETTTYQIDDVVLTGDEKAFEGTLLSDVTNDEIDFEYVASGSESSSVSYTLTYASVANDITVTTSSDFYLSTDGSAWSQSITITASGDGEASVMVKYVPSDNYIVGIESLIEHRVEDAATYEITVSADGSIEQQDADLLDKEATLDIVTWNLEWFGSPSNSDNASSFDEQLEYVSAKIVELDADIYAFQEVVMDDVNGDYFTPLLEKLDEIAGENTYLGAIADKYSFYFYTATTSYPAQRTCYIYNTNSISNLESFSMFEDVYDGSSTTSIDGYTGTASTFWVSGRLPQLMEVIATINGKSEALDIINIHAKCCTGYEERREADATYLYNAVLSDYADDNVIILGDYNDGVADGDTYESWYENDNENFLHATGDGIDHISLSNELSTEYYSLSNNEYSESVTISDHDPIMIRLLLDSDKTLQTVSLSDIDDQVTSAAVQLSASASSGLSVEYIVVSGDASISDDELTFTGDGEVIVQAVQQGDDAYAPAFSNLVSFTVSKLEQTITFEAIEDKTMGDDTFELVATASSGLSVTFEVVTGEVTIEDNIVTLVDAGDVTIKATQAGDDDYESAEASQSFLVEDKSGVEEEFAKQVLVYPNPATSDVVVEMPESTLKVLKLVDISGVTLKEMEAYDTAEFSISDLPAGLYFIQIASGDITISKKLQVQH